MRVFLRALLAGLLVLGLGQPAGAQELRGTVRETATGLPIRGAVLLLLDSAGDVRARNITDEHGIYRIAAAAWMRHLRVVRIGFRPRELDLPPIDKEVITIDVAMTPIPVLLEPVHVKTGATCPKRDDRLAALSLLEQARAGLLATVVAREARPAAIVRLRFTSQLRDGSDVADSMRVQIDSSDTTHVSFIAPHTAADFVRRGFAVQDSGSTTFDGPDAETLLDDDFRDGYCFELRHADQARPNQVGLGFVAAKSERGRIDIDATLWIDTVARRLTDIQFKYVNLPSAVEAIHAGGEVWFRELDNGVVIIDRWMFRIPASSRPSAIGNGGRFTIRPHVGVQTTGGVVASARWPGGLQWDAPLGRLRAHAFEPDGKPAVGRELMLANTAYHAIVDSSGVAEIGRLIPGPYVALMREPRLDSIQIGLKTQFAFVVADSSTIGARFEVPTAAAYVRSRCRLSSINPTQVGDFLIIGRVFDPKGHPIKSVSWSLSRRNSDFVDSFKGTTGDDGIFEFCGNQFRNDDDVTIQIGRAQGAAQVVRKLHVNDRLTVIRVELPASR